MGHGSECCRPLETKCLLLLSSAESDALYTRDSLARSVSSEQLVSGCSSRRVAQEIAVVGACAYWRLWEPSAYCCGDKAASRGPGRSRACLWDERRQAGCNPRRPPREPGPGKCKYAPDMCMPSAIPLPIPSHCRALLSRVTYHFALSIAF
jgi:hypothetical protein